MAKNFEILKSDVKLEIRKPLDGVSENLSIESARSFTYAIMASYWFSILSLKDSEKSFNLRSCPGAQLYRRSLSVGMKNKAKKIGQILSKYNPTEAGYLAGSIYTSLLPNEYRSRHGVYYTPPSLTNRLIEQAENAGVVWKSATILDPACGGGAFLTPIIEKKMNALSGMKAKKLFKILSKSICGFEIDPFSAWLTNIFVDVVTLDLCLEVGKKLPVLTKIKDSLQHMERYPEFDLVIGNPPYSKIKLDTNRRQQYQRSLYGHANLYGLFTDQALNFAKPDGVVAFVTPSSFLSGQYFKNLRSLLAKEAPPYSIDFVSDRAGVFGDVLQETVLATYRKGQKNIIGSVALLQFSKEGSFKAISLGHFKLDKESTSPWLMPRSREQASLISQLSKIKYRLNDYGYKVSTGPLVWNRHKDQLKDRKSKYTYPLIWAESISSNGGFIFKAEKKNHKPFFKIEGEKDNWLIVDTPCVLLQRTTSLEQERRLIAAELPVDFIKKYGAAVIENHINMIRPINKNIASSVSVKAITAIFNSRTLDQVFRCYNGSVAVSAYELESLPLPGPNVIKQIENIVRFNKNNDLIEQILRGVYFNEESATTA